MLSCDEAIIIGFSAIGTNFKVNVQFWNSGSFIGSDYVVIAKSTVGSTPAGWRNAVNAAITAYCSTNGITDPATKWSAIDGEAGVAIAGGQGAIANVSGTAANNNVTNYNLVSGILGLANGLNSSNTAQNDMADIVNNLVSKFNTMKSELVSAGMILP